MRDRLAAVAAERWDVPPESIEFEGGELSVCPPWDQEARTLVEGKACRISLGEAVRWLLEEGHAPKLTYRYDAPATRPLGEGGDMHFAFGYGVQAAEVEVDERTGKVTVLRLVAASDGGRALNPHALLGQIEGGLVMGVGTALTEEYKIENGIPQTRRWKDYKIPLIHQMPRMDIHIVEHPVSTGPYGAKGIGELPSIPTSPAISNAIFNAVGVRAYRLPIRPEDIALSHSKEE
jgi:xanthine dehydrogenase molybdenum-binding subunit